MEKTLLIILFKSLSDMQTRKMKAGPELEISWISITSHLQETLPGWLPIRKMRVPHSLHWPIIHLETSCSFLWSELQLLTPIWVAHPYLSELLTWRVLSLNCIVCAMGCKGGSISKSMLTSLGQIKAKWKQLSWLLDRQLPTSRFFRAKK